MKTYLLQENGMNKRNRMKYVFASVSFVLAALGSKVSLAYWASAVLGSNSNSTGTVTSGTWDRYSTGTAVNTCANLQTMLQANTSSTYYLTTNLSCPTTTLTTNARTFSGTFYGNGYTISNIAMTNGRPALFYNINGATIQNLILDNVDVGTSSSRVTAAAGGILASTTSGTGNQISKIRIYNSTVYANTTNGAGGILGQASSGTTISNVMLQNVIVNNSNTGTSSGAGGIVGKMSATVDISDVYFEGSLSSPYNSGGIVGNIDNATGSLLSVSRAVTFANTSFRATSGYAGGIVGRNQRTASHSLTDVFFTGALYAASSRAGTIYNGTAMTYTNAWAAQWSWDNTPAIAYTAMTGTSANYTTNYEDYRSSLDTTWWATNLSNIASLGPWTYDSSTYLYELKPKV